jgi:hypothetical protein
MTRYWGAGALLLVMAAAPIAFAQKEEAAKPGSPPAAQNQGSAPAAPKAPPNIGDPGASVALRLLQMTPEQRERALEKFPPERQAQIRQGLERLDSLPPQQKQRRIRLYQMLVALPPEKQLLVRRQIQAYNRLPPERKQVVAPEMRKLDRMPEDERQARLASDEFKNKFTPAEREMLAVISQYLPLL